MQRDPRGHLKDNCTTGGDNGFERGHIKTKMSTTIKNNTNSSDKIEEANPFRPSGKMIRSPIRGKQQSQMGKIGESLKAVTTTRTFDSQRATGTNLAQESGENALNNEVEEVQIEDTPRTTNDKSSVMIENTGMKISHSSPRQEFILKMRASEEDTVNRLRNVLRKIRHAMTRQRNINMEVQNGISEMEELVDIMGDYRKNWKKAEAEKNKSKASINLTKQKANVIEDTPTAAQKRTATSPTEVLRPAKVQRETRRKGAKRLEQEDQITLKPMEPAKPPDEWKIVGRRKKRRKRFKERSEAVMVRPRDGHNYAEVLKSLKEKVKPEEADIAVKSIRKTKAGDILLELEKGGEKKGFCEVVKESLKEVAEVKDLSKRAKIEIRDVEGSTTTEEVCIAVRRAADIGEEDISVHLTRPNEWDQKRAFVSLTVSGANRLLKLERIKIGWVNCRVRRCEELKRCFRCFERGHTQRECKGPDRNGMGLCIRCAEKGHILKQCSNPPKCCLCLEEGKDAVDHIPGSKLCSAGRKLY